MKQYLYAILDEYGKCWVVKDDATEKVRGLPSLLAEGWHPVRETPFVGDTTDTYILILLERDGD